MAGFWIYQSSEYASGSEYVRAIQCSQYAWICLNNSWIGLIILDYTWVFLNMSEYAWICHKSAWIAFVSHDPIVISCLLECVVKSERTWGCFLEEAKFSSWKFLIFCFRLNIFKSKISTSRPSAFGAKMVGGCESWYTINLIKIVEIFLERLNIV